MIQYFFEFIKVLNKGYYHNVDKINIFEMASFAVFK
jgi:hypothetical protein